MSYTEMSPEKDEKKVLAHPKVSVMVDTAIKNLADRKGSSLHAIKNYIDANYTVDIEKLSKFVKKYLKASVERGDLVQTTGKGASGSFKFNKQKAIEKPNEKKPKLKSPKAPKVKSLKHLKMQTSTPNKVKQSKKAATKSPTNSPVKKVKLADLEEVPADATFSNPKTKKAKKPKVSLLTKPRKSATLPKKVKPKKLVAKKTEPKVPTSPGVKSANKSPKLKTKPQGRKAAKTKKSLTPRKPDSILKKAAKTKKSLTPRKPDSILKKAASKKASAKGGQK